MNSLQKENYDYIKYELNIVNSDKECAADIVFTYKETPCVIIPYGIGGEKHGFCCLYGDKDLMCDTFEHIMNTPFWDGKTLLEILDQIEW